MAEHLKSEGYETYLVGKWHLGNSMMKYHPKNRGFNHFYGLLGKDTKFKGTYINYLCVVQCPN